jgi:hypothetical protein
VPDTPPPLPHVVQIPPIAQKLTKAFEWIFHMGQNQVLDSDAMLLHIQVCGWVLRGTGAHDLSWARVYVWVWRGCLLVSPAFEVRTS